MSTDTKPCCPRCGAALREDAAQGLCPRCLAALSLGTETVPDDPHHAATQRPLTPAELAPHFPQLEISECLGRGGMGVVYKARQRSLNRIVALKLLAPERVSDETFAARFEREAQALAALNHPNIVTVHDFGKAGGFYFLLMEFVDGVNLRQAMKGGRFTPEQALAIVPPVCEALQYAHEHGIVHRDIKPENLLLDKDGRVKIADFGIAKILGANSKDGPTAEGSKSSTLQHTAAGTPQYMAPEQRSDPQKADHRADIYSLGVVLYELLTGELPGSKLQPPSRKVQVDVRLDEIVLRALETNPEMRFSTAAEFRTQVETVASDSSRGPGASHHAKSSEEIQVASSLAPAIGIVTLFALIISGIFLVGALPINKDSGYLFLTGVSTCIAILAGFLGANRIRSNLRKDGESRETARACINGIGWLAMMLALPTIALGIFFLIAATDEGWRWNPSRSEAVFVPLTWMGSIALPWAGLVLLRLCASKDSWVRSRRIRPVAFALLILALNVVVAANLLQKRLRQTVVKAQDAKTNLQTTAQRSELKSKQDSEDNTYASSPAEWIAMGTVTDVDGKPVSDAEVFVSTGMGSLRTWPIVRTDADGHYRINFGPGFLVPLKNQKETLQAAVVGVRKSGFEERELCKGGDLKMAWELPPWSPGASRTFLPGKPRRVDFVLVPAATISGRLVTPDGKPAAGRGIVMVGDRLRPASSIYGSTKTDQNGRFVFKNISTLHAWSFSLADDPRYQNRTPPDRYSEAKVYEVDFVINGKSLAPWASLQASAPQIPDHINFKVVNVESPAGSRTVLIHFERDSTPGLGIEVCQDVKSPLSEKLPAFADAFWLRTSWIGLDGPRILSWTLPPQFSPDVVKAAIPGIEKELRAMREALSKLPNGSVPKLASIRHPDGWSYEMFLRIKPEPPKATEPASKRERFVPKPGMALDTSWTIFDKPSFLNPDGWAVMTRMTLGGTARIQIPGEPDRRCDITLVSGNDESVTIRIDDLIRKSTMTLSLPKGRPGEITVDGTGYRVVYLQVEVAAKDPDESAFAHVIVTPAGQPKQKPD